MMGISVCSSPKFNNIFNFNFSFSEELLIDFQEFIGQHSGENMAEGVWATMELYGLIGKVSSVLPIDSYVSNLFIGDCYRNG